MLGKPRKEIWLDRSEAGFWNTVNRGLFWRGSYNGWPSDAGGRYEDVIELPQCRELSRLKMEPNT